VPDYSNQSVLEAAVAPGSRRDLLASWLREQAITPSEQG
jgi:hypothetical protein